jgi:hypothetical protein
MEARNAIIVAAKENLIVRVCVVSDHNAASRWVYDAAAVRMRIYAVA